MIGVEPHELYALAGEKILPNGYRGTLEVDGSHS